MRKDKKKKLIQTHRKDFFYYSAYLLVEELRNWAPFCNDEFLRSRWAEIYEYLFRLVALPYGCGDIVDVYVNFEVENSRDNI